MVEREERSHDTGYEDVLLHTTPSTAEILDDILWHRSGPTAPRDDVRIDWVDGHRETVLAAVDHPVQWKDPDLPATRLSYLRVTAGRPSSPLTGVSNLVMRRGRAERSPYDIRGSVELPLADADDYDLVTVAAPPDANRHPDIDNKSD